MRRFVFILIIISITSALTGCNTMRGFGTDIKKSGEFLERVGR